MKPKEYGAVGFAVVIIGTVVLIDVLWAVALNNSAWFGAGSNLIQFTSGPGLFVGIVMGLWMRWHRTCAVPWCLRSGEHPVKDTLKKVCHDHHTVEHHTLVHDLHGEAHRLAGRLGWGESHKKAKANRR